MDIGKITLHCQEGTSNKLYIIWAEARGDEYVILAQWGAVGKALQSGTKTPEPVSLEKATAIMQKVVKTKMAKGYLPYGDEAPVYTHVDGTEDTGIRVMLLTPGSEEDLDRLINSDDWGAQEKMNGKHIAVTTGKRSFPFKSTKVGLTTKDSVVGSNRRGLVCPIPKAIENAINGTDEDDINRYDRSAILDGELIGDTLYVFDIVSEGESVASRYETYSYIVDMINSNNIQAVPLIRGTENKAKLLAELKAGNKEGIVFKRLDGKYTPGKIMNIKKAIAIKVKFYSEGSFIVDHWNEKNSISVHAYKGKGTSRVGRLTVKGKETVHMGNVTVPDKYRPQIVVGGIVSVRYLYATEASILYQPNLNPDDNGDVMRDDIPKEDCTIEQLKYEGK